MEDQNVDNRSGPQYSLGTSFLHYVYTSLRYDPPAVGFTPLAPGGAVLKDPMETPKSSATTQVSKSLSFMVAGAAAAALLL